MNSEVQIFFDREILSITWVNYWRINKNKTVRLYSPKLAAASKGLVKSKGFLIRLLKILFEVIVGLLCKISTNDTKHGKLKIN